MQTVSFASRLSPLHDRFPGKMVHEAAQEARQLTEEKRGAALGIVKIHLSMSA